MVGIQGRKNKAQQGVFSIGLSRILQQPGSILTINTEYNVKLRNKKK